MKKVNDFIYDPLNFSYSYPENKIVRLKII